MRDSINRYQELINYAIELEQEVIAFTEHETITNAIKIEEYYNKIKEKNPNFKIILGNEIYLCRDGLNEENFDKDADRYYHFILLAKDSRGHEQIREISTRAWLRSYIARGMRRVPTYYQDLVEIIGADPGHVVGSTACLGGFLATKLLQYKENQNPDFFTNIVVWLNQMNNLFGKGNFYLEMQPSAYEEQKIVNQYILQISKKIDIPYIITCDSHYLKKEDAFIHKAFLNSQDGDREVDTFYATTYLMDTTELESYLSYMTQEELSKAYENIIKIKDSCEIYSLKKELKIPSLMWRQPKNLNRDLSEYYCIIPWLQRFCESEFIGDRTMAQLIIEKIESDPKLQVKEIYDELNSNLETTWISSEVNKVHWSAYFLNLQYTIDVCWDAGTVVGPGRGSGVGFLLLYLLDIIQINKMWEKTPCFPWRFLNPERVSVLD